MSAVRQLEALADGPQLGSVEANRLAELERVIDAGARTFMQVGDALLEVRARRLYREKYPTFEDYCRERWGFSRQRAHQLIDAAELSTVVDTAGLPTPPNEAVARELAPLKDDAAEVVAVWHEAQADAATLGVRLSAQVVRNATRKRLARIRREHEAVQARIVALPPSTDGVRIEHCAIRELEVEPGSVDLIFTDPPYLASTIGCYSDLAEFASWALRPGAMLVAYSGNVHALECANRLAERLSFVAWGCVYMPGARNAIHKYRMRVHTKPLLFFSRGDYEPRDWWDDLFTSPKVDKGLHPWQQSEGDAEPLFEALTYPGELICDPFVGSGTVAVVARRLGRRFVGCDTDPAAVATARARLAEAREAAA